MIESISDFLSIAVLVFFLVMGVYFLYFSGLRDTEASMARIEARYYRYYDSADDDANEDKNETYFEES